MRNVHNFWLPFLLYMDGIKKIVKKDNDIFIGFFSSEIVHLSTTILWMLPICNGYFLNEHHYIFQCLTPKANSLQ